MTTREFNEKWKDYLEEGFYGLAIPLENVINYLDDLFETELTKDPTFRYSQIKMKFNWACFYSNAQPDIRQRIEDNISKIVKEYETTNNLHL